MYGHAAPARAGPAPAPHQQWQALSPCPVAEAAAKRTPEQTGQWLAFLGGHGIHPKLTVSNPGDADEREADAVAERVMRMPEPGAPVTRSGPKLHRKCANCEEDSKGKIARQFDRPTASRAASAVSRGGIPLGATERAFFEPRFGHDLSAVRIHTGSTAVSAARGIGALAYTHGQDIAFAAGQYQPDTHSGRRLLAHELAHTLQQSGQAPAIQRQPSPIAGSEAEKASLLVRVERYRGSTQARAFFADGSHEEVTFVDTRGLDGNPDQMSFETVVRLTLDRSSLIRPHVERAPRNAGAKVKVVTRLSPADRISLLPSRVRGEVWEAVSGDAESAPDPDTMEFAADMGERLNEASDTMRITMTGRDPATVATMQTVDQWVSEQSTILDRVGSYNRNQFTRLLDEIRQVGVTGQVPAEDLVAQDVELVLAGVAGGQSDFQTFAEFKRRMNFELRTGRGSIPQEHAHNPDFFMRNEFRKAWKAEAASLRHMSKIAEAAQAAPFIALGASAVIGAAPALAGAGSTYLTSQGVSLGLQAKWVSASLFASGGIDKYLDARKEAKAAGMDPNSALGIGNTFSTAVLRASGVGEVSENISNTSILTGESLNRSPAKRVLGAVFGLLDIVGNAHAVTPKAPRGVPVVAESSAAKAGGRNANPTVVPEPTIPVIVPEQPNPSVTQGGAGRFSPSAEFEIPGPHPFGKKPAANENIVPPPPEAQVAEIPLAQTGTGGPASTRVAVNEPVQTGTVAGATKMSGPRKPANDANPSVGSVRTSPDLPEKGQQASRPTVIPARVAPSPGLAASDVLEDIDDLIGELKLSSLSKPKTRKVLEDLRKETLALEQAGKNGADISEELADVARRRAIIDNSVAGEIAEEIGKRVPKPAALPPRPGEVRNRTVPTATKPSGSFSWIEDDPAMSDFARNYEHGTTGARSSVASKRGQVPALDWIKPGGTQGRVKFDGMDGTVFIDRKTSLYRQSAPEQALRQSEALRQNGYTARWEVPDAVERAAAERMFADLGITNIAAVIVPTK